ncbi:MAG: helix-hairpin-helix domain-containing protein, partial [Prevotella sp.]|nr:helix-hairpin-helix domain-containing protein [Prevotella sp.]
AFPTYYGQGLRLAAYARCDLSSRLRLALRLGYTNYFDRSTIGTALQEIAHSHQTDLDLQLRWRL